MSNKSLLLFFLLCLGLPISVQSADSADVDDTPPENAYYVSSLTGDDANDGRKNQPWKTISRVNEEMFDENAAILFKRGEIFRGAISSYKFQTGLTFGAYGTGDNPIIAGSVSITDWKRTKHPALGSKVYEADVSAFIVEDKKGNENKIQHLFVNGEMMTIARYPNVDSPANKNWLKVGKSAGKNAFTDPALVDYAKPNGYWKDAILRIRTYSWYYKVFKITGYTAKNGKITAKGLGNQLPEWGYFLDDKLEELDHPGEWYYDAVAKKVYLYPRGNVNPNTLLVEGSTYKTGLSIYWHEDNSIVKNLTFRHFTSVGVTVNNSDNVTVRNCHFEYNTKGISVYKSANFLVTDNTFNHQLSNAIGVSAPKDFNVQASAVEKNQITNTGLFPLYCTRYEGVCYGTAVSVFGKAQTIRQNTIENTGWIGIYLKDGGHHLIENNLVRKSLLLLNDGGAISIGSNGNTIRGNFLLESLGNVDESNGCGSLNKTPCSHHPTYGMGIGADNNFKDNVIEGNTVANNPDMGIRLNAFINTVVRNNVVYNNDPQIVIQDKKGPSRKNVVEGNIIYSLTPDQRGLVLTGATNHGTFKNKFYCNPYNETVFVRDGKQYSLAHWKKAFSSYDKNAKWCGVRFEEYRVSNVDANLLSKSEFQMALQTKKASSYSTNRFAMRENQYYRLRFGILGEGFGAIRVRVNNAPKGGKTEILKATTFAYDSTHKDYEMFFLSPRAFEQGILVFSTIKAGSIGADSIDLDNVAFEPVEAVLNDANKQSALFTNPTENPKTIDLKGIAYQNLAGEIITGSITLAPFSSQILVAGEVPSEEMPSAIPPAPKLSVTQNGRKVTVAWDAIAGATGYVLYYAPYTDSNNIGYLDMAQQTHFSVELFPGSAFYVAVTAYNEVGESDYSNIELFQIP